MSLWVLWSFWEKKKREKKIFARNKKKKIKNLH